MGMDENTTTKQIMNQYQRHKIMKQHRKGSKNKHSNNEEEIIIQKNKRSCSIV
jgi:hypothetical protein